MFNIPRKKMKMMRIPPVKTDSSPHPPPAARPCTTPPPPSSVLPSASLPLLRAKIKTFPLLDRARFSSEGESVEQSCCSLPPSPLKRKREVGLSDQNRGEQTGNEWTSKDALFVVLESEEGCLEFFDYFRKVLMFIVERVSHFFKEEFLDKAIQLSGDFECLDSDTEFWREVRNPERLFFENSSSLPPCALIAGHELAKCLLILSQLKEVEAPPAGEDNAGICSNH